MSLLFVIVTESYALMEEVLGSELILYNFN